MDPIQPISCQDPCPPRCDNPFSRVVVSYLIRGGTTVFWELHPTFTAMRPYRFQLQVGESRSNCDDDWIDVGTQVTDIFYAVDGEQRTYSKNRWAFYRVRLVCDAGTFYSDPVALEGTLDFRDWRICRDILRQHRNRMRQGGAQLGYLLKRRVTGEPCPRCLDPQTQEVRDPACPVCSGTGFKCGYFFPIGCVLADISGKKYHASTDGTRGSISDIVVSATMFNTWAVFEEDLFVVKVSDERFYVHSVTNTTEWKGVPLIASVELRPAPMTDPAYAIVIPDQVDALEALLCQNTNQLI